MRVAGCAPEPYVHCPSDAHNQQLHYTQISSCVLTVCPKCPLSADRYEHLSCDLARRGRMYRDCISHLSLCPPRPMLPMLPVSLMDRRSSKRDRTNVSGAPDAVKLVRFQKFNHTDFMIPSVSRRLYRTIEGSRSGETGIQRRQPLNGACTDYCEVTIRHDMIADVRCEPNQLRPYPSS